MSFRVLIVGGSITGLSLAAMLERYGIDYILVEKHADVAPEIGASIGLLAHGSRILDQLGCLEELLPWGCGVQDFVTTGPDGKALVKHAHLGTYLNTMLGYTIFFVERQRVLRALWNGIKDKSKIHLSTALSKIEHLDGGVQIETQDGRVFTGSIVVGADGVHSGVRNEMWRLAEADGIDISGDRRAHGLTQVKLTETLKNARQDRHYLIIGAPNELTFWFLFFKNKKNLPWDRLRYTDEDKEQYVAEFGNDQVRPDLTFGEMYRSSTRTGIVPVEEFVLGRYHYKRVMLLGDSIHRMHPVSGHGGNAAIEDAASFANRLKDVLEGNPNPTFSQLEEIFEELQKERIPRMKHLTRSAAKLAGLEMFSTRLLKLIMLYLYPSVPVENILASLGESMTQGEPLKYLPLPMRSKKLVPFDDEIQLHTKNRSSTASYAWTCLFFLIASLRFALPSNGLPFSDQPVLLSAWQSSTHASYIAVNAFWAIESYRSAFSLGPIVSPILWILFAQICGWELALPFYFASWVNGSYSRGFYHPWPRAILPAGAQALPLVVAVAAPAPTLISDFLAGIPQLAWFNSLTLVHLIIPVGGYLIDTFLTRRHGLRWEPFYQFGDWDMTYLTCFFSLTFLVAAYRHISFILAHVIPLVNHGHGLLLLRSPELVNFGVFSLLIAAFVQFTAWDLRRVNVLRTNLALAALVISVAIIVLGPGATLIGTWWWREKAWEKARRRRSDERYESVKGGVA
ncbi:FAD-dependent oxidoreductase [Aspergillus mulundensis]|uniref:FAD-binding domain-containing protein n=1 Tax=Aspergillus mulundensis TaxID=1810919 RepID=A0A3D8RZ37_9EURO|nr:Uncharacterized protein DSM5745_06154 [Aspergillus mulundensis]RDW79302.1 Uncharacterized protein DSM5745_06154 [Aspergillus mulundensis]